MSDRYSPSEVCVKGRKCGPMDACPYRDYECKASLVDSKIATARDKAPLQFVPLRWLIGLARVFQYGAIKKHGRENYYASEDDPESCERYIGGLLRHLSDMQTPGGSYTPESCVALDAESGLPHIDHAMAGLVMLRARLCKAGAMPADPGPQGGLT